MKKHGMIFLEKTKIRVQKLEEGKVFIRFVKI